MLSAWLEGLGGGVSGFISFLQDLLTSVVSIFYTAPTGSETVGSLTDFGILAAAALGIGFVFMAIRWITKLLKFNF